MLMWEFMCKLVESSGVSGVLIVLAFALVIIIIKQEKNLKTSLIELNKDILETTASSLASLNEHMIDIVEGLNDLALLYAKLSNEKVKEET